ncbi:MAG: hypothetical protein HFE78_03325 [Clostridiales bacterium]|nr:hypothetical protein [Clostridiales bacterium]
MEINMPEKKSNRTASANKKSNGHAASVSSRVRQKNRHKPMRTMEISKVKSTGEVIQNRSAKRNTSQMRRPKPRRHPANVTAEYGKVRPRKVRKRKGAVVPGGAKQKIITVKVKGQRLPWHLIVTALAATLVIMAMVINYVRLNELTNECSRMQQEIVSLTATRKKLTLALEQKNDLLYFEQEAVKMGMVKSDRVEKKYVRMENDEKIAVPEGSDSGVGAFFGDLWGNIVQIFRNIFG